MQAARRADDRNRREVRRRFEQLDILLCDIQGAELGMLADCEHLLARGGVRFLVLSTQRLNDAFGEQKTVGLSSLRRRGQPA